MRFLFKNYIVTIYSYLNFTSLIHGRMSLVCVHLCILFDRAQTNVRRHASCSFHMSCADDIPVICMSAAVSTHSGLLTRKEGKSFFFFFNFPPAVATAYLKKDWTHVWILLSVMNSSIKVERACARISHVMLFSINSYYLLSCHANGWSSSRKAKQLHFLLGKK